MKKLLISLLALTSLSGFAQTSRPVKVYETTYKHVYSLDNCSPKIAEKFVWCKESFTGNKFPSQALDRKLLKVDSAVNNINTKSCSVVSSSSLSGIHLTFKARAGGTVSKQLALQCIDELITKVGADVEFKYRFLEFKAE